MIKKQKILKIYEEENSVAATARRAGTNYQVVNRVLITNGIIPPGNAEIVDKLTKRGYTRAEIAKELGIAEKSLKTYLPYDRHSYVVGEKTKNAEKNPPLPRKEKGEKRK